MRGLERPYLLPSVAAGLAIVMVVLGVEEFRSGRKIRALEWSVNELRSEDRAINARIADADPKRDVEAIYADLSRYREEIRKVRDLEGSVNELRAEVRGVNSRVTDMDPKRDVEAVYADLLSYREEIRGIVAKYQWLSDRVMVADSSRRVVSESDLREFRARLDVTEHNIRTMQRLISEQRETIGALSLRKDASQPH